MGVLQPNLDPTRRELRQFGLLLFPAFFGLVGGLVLYTGGALSTALTVWGVSLGLTALGLLSAKFLLGLYLAWMYLVFPIGWTVSHAVLAVTFYLVITPIGLLMSLLRPDALRRKRAPDEQSNWTASESEDEIRTYLRQF